MNVFSLTQSRGDAEDQGGKNSASLRLCVRFTFQNLPLLSEILVQSKRLSLPQKNLNALDLKANTISKRKPVGKQANLSSLVHRIKDAIEAISIRVVSQRSRRGRDLLTLPKKSGNEELVDVCFDLLDTNVTFDRRRTILNTIKANASKDECETKWLERLEAKDGDDLTHWIRFGTDLGLLSRQPTERLEKWLEDGDK